MMNLIMLALLWSGLANADFTESEMQFELNKFKTNPQQFYLSLSPKKGATLPSQIEPESLLEKKKAFREEILTQQRLQLLSAPKPNDRAQSFIEEGSFIMSLKGLEHVKQGASEIQPWSDDYWPYYKGGVAYRYADRGFPGSHDWQNNFDYVSSNPFYSIFSMGNSQQISKLSPAEKYDLLIGGGSGILTDRMWREGEKYYREHGKVETWMGICHGWAPAAYMMKRPIKPVEVVAHDGHTRIKFYPDDIKALGSLLWANAKTPVKFVGGRCKERNPPADDLGRPMNPDCLDSNPATFHLIMANRMGVSKRPFIMDNTYDYEVWNQPIISYRYFYFNPKTLDLARTLQSAAVNVNDFSNDKFRAHRAPGTTQVVGVKMQVTYGMERRGMHLEVEGPQYDIKTTILLTYDLELDSQGNIIGGEWYRKAHPDFLWTPTKDTKAMARNDHLIASEPNWDGQSPLPAKWQEYARQSAASGQPLAKIIDSLLALSLR